MSFNRYDAALKTLDGNFSTPQLIESLALISKGIKNEPDLQRFHFDPERSRRPADRS